jgi:acyl carrier protein
VNPKVIDLLVTDLELKPEAVREDATLAEAGLDSLSLVELSTTLQQRWGVQIGEDQLATATTVAELDHMLTDRIPAPAQDSR